MLNALELVHRLVAARIAAPNEIIGCTSAEIANIEITVKVVLPNAYVEFLRAVGKSAGRFMSDVDFLYPAVLDLNAEAADILKNWEHGALLLPPKSFVWSMRYGEQFMFFSVDGTGSDVPIYYYYENSGSFKKLADSFWDVLEQELAMQEAVRQRHPDAFRDR